MNVAVLGASNKPERYSYKAVKLLQEKGHTTFPVHPVLDKIDGIRVYKSLLDISESVDTVSVYLSPENSNKTTEDILKSGARRIIFNPGSENPELAGTLKKRGFTVVEACTLVLLKTEQF
jgi:predicted CoA-binding protein